MDNLILACSGEGAPIAIYRAELFATMAAYVQGAMLLLTSTIYIRSFVSPIACTCNIALMVAHPAFISSARGGDCGGSMMIETMVWIFLGVTVTGHVIRRYHSSRSQSHTITAQ